MTLTETLPLVGVLAFAGFGAFSLARAGGTVRVAWQWPAGLALLFLGFTLWPVLREGLLGFWPPIAQSLWGNQIALDLLCAWALSWCWLAPRARAQGMWLPLWLLLVLSTGSIALLGMLARLLYLEARARVRT